MGNVHNLSKYFVLVLKDGFIWVLNVMCSFGRRVKPWKVCMDAFVVGVFLCTTALRRIFHLSFALLIDLIGIWFFYCFRVWSGFVKV